MTILSTFMTSSCSSNPFLGSNKLNSNNYKPISHAIICYLLVSNASITICTGTNPIPLAGGGNSSFLFCHEFNRLCCSVSRNQFQCGGELVRESIDVHYQEQHQHYRSTRWSGRAPVQCPAQLPGHGQYINTVRNGIPFEIIRFLWR